MTVETVMADSLAGFAGRLRAAGLVVDLPRLTAAAEALTMLPVLTGATPYWPLRLTLCGRRSDVTVFDDVYRAWFEEPANSREPAPDEDLDVVVIPEAGAQAAAESGDGGPEPSEASGGAAYVNALAARDLRTLTDAEKAYVARLIAELAPVARPRRAPRRVPRRSGRIDATRTVRLMIHNGGEPTRLRRHRRDRRPRRLLFLIDVSRSILPPYLDAYLLFANAAVTAGPTTTEVFTIGTRWTRVTAELRAAGPQEAMRAVDAVKNDWGQGTRLGRSLESLLRRYPNHRILRSVVVVICSDGLEEDRDLQRLPRQVARLSRIAHRIIWVNPAKRHANYRPVLGSLREALGYADHRLSGHTLEQLTKLAEVIRA